MLLIIVIYVIKKKTNLRKREKAKLLTFNFLEIESDTLEI